MEEASAGDASPELERVLSASGPRLGETWLEFGRTRSQS